MKLKEEKERIERKMPPFYFPSFADESPDMRKVVYIGAEVYSSDALAGRYLSDLEPWNSWPSDSVDIRTRDRNLKLTLLPYWLLIMRYIQKMVQSYRLREFLTGIQISSVDWQYQNLSWQYSDSTYADSEHRDRHRVLFAWVLAELPIQQEKPRFCRLFGAAQRVPRGAAAIGFTIVSLWVFSRFSAASSL